MRFFVSLFCATDFIVPCGWGYLQRVPRTGWVYRNVKKPESVSDHMYRMAMMSLTITDPTVDKDRYLTHTACTHTWKKLSEIKKRNIY